MAPLRKAAEKAEAELEALSAERASIDIRLSDPAVYSGPPEQVAALSRRQRELEPIIAAAEERWLEAVEALEAAMSAVEA